MKIFIEDCDYKMATKWRTTIIERERGRKCHMIRLLRHLCFGNRDKNDEDGLNLSQYIYLSTVSLIISPSLIKKLKSNISTDSTNRTLIDNTPVVS